MSYKEFLKRKHITTKATGFEPLQIGSGLFEWQSDIVRWAIKKGKCALFEDCGLGKTIQQLEWSRQVSKHTSLPVLILAPLAVAKQTQREGVKFGYAVTVCRTQADAKPGINISNYEMLEHFEPAAFGGVVLDESSILKHHDSKTREMITRFFKDTQYKLSCTATPAPNDFMELGNQAEFLGIMSCTEMLATFFVHDGGDTSKWRLKGHAKNKFWEWLASWAVVLTTPKDLGYSADGYDLPKLNMAEHIVKSEPSEEDGQTMLDVAFAQTLQERRQARRDSLTSRCQMAADLIIESPNEQWLVWCDLNGEADDLKKIIDGAVEVRGSDTNDFKANTLEGFTTGTVRYLVTKPSIAGFGLNWQSCHNMIFVGLSDSYEMMYQAIRRCWRFGQKDEVNVHIVISEAEGAVKQNIERKERQSKEMTSEMVKYSRTILEGEIRGTTRETIDYNPQIEMILPDWLAA